ncbi:hypothetical protein [Dongia sp.]|uniref:hypothetical protein n=1 Tax=Dongia sp. TaxID=1977262 RepID=UPI0035AE3B50
MGVAAVRESEVLQSIVARLEDEGFEVFLQPSSFALPPFLKNFRPDAIARRGDKKILIEVLTGRERDEQRANELKRLLQDQDEWELRVFYAPPTSSKVDLDIMPTETIEAELAEFRNLASGGGAPFATLMMGWTILEAIGRSLLPGRLTRPQGVTPLISALASEGYVTPTEADQLREIGQIRNRAAHGGLDTRIDRQHIEVLARILIALASMLPGHSLTPSK